MCGQAAGRVIVGIDDTRAGLQALREAVGLARRGSMELLAVRASRLSPAGADFSCWPSTGPALAATQSPQRLCTLLARSFVDHAFSEAMGGMPHDVAVDILIANQSAHRALTAAAFRDADLLVVGASRHHLWRPQRRSVGRYCTAHVGCPVLIVPSHETARELNRTRGPWNWLRKRRDFGGLLPGASPAR